jgi:deoxycytidylate deaminase
MDTIQRMTKPEYIMAIAKLVSLRSTCHDAQVGAVITTDNYQILATGYNGMLPGMPECTGDGSCKITRNSQSAGVSRMCPTIHAEANALRQYRTHTGKPKLPHFGKIFVTTAPCLSCLQQLYDADIYDVYYGSKNSWLEPVSTLARRMGIRFVYQPVPDISAHLSHQATMSQQSK